MYIHKINGCTSQKLHVHIGKRNPNSNIEMDTYSRNHRTYAFKFPQVRKFNLGRSQCISFHSMFIRCFCSALA